MLTNPYEPRRSSSVETRNGRSDFTPIFLWTERRTLPKYRRTHAWRKLVRAPSLLFGALFDPLSAPKADLGQLWQIHWNVSEKRTRVGSLLEADGVKVWRLFTIICRDTYGKFSELAAYDWLMRNQLKITTQLKMGPSDILGANEAIIDGLVDHCGMYFDIKAFGFHGHLAQRLKGRLEKELPGDFVYLEESWDLSIDLFAQLIGDPPNIASELKTKRSKQIGPLRIQAKAPEPINVSGRIVSPYLLAKENASYPFRSANQFTRNAPFISIFTIHPWLNGSAIFNNFAGSDVAFTRAFASRAFMQSTHYTQSLNTVCKQVGANVTFADAAKLLSAIIFINAWPETHELGREAIPSAVYLNPRALHPLGHRARLFRAINPNILIEDFIHDDY